MNKTTSSVPRFLKAVKVFQQHRILLYSFFLAGIVLFGVHKTRADNAPVFIVDEALTYAHLYLYIAAISLLVVSEVEAFFLCSLFKDTEGKQWLRSVLLVTAFLIIGSLVPLLFQDTTNRLIDSHFWGAMVVLVVGVINFLRATWLGSRARERYPEYFQDSEQ